MHFLIHYTVYISHGNLEFFFFFSCYSSYYFLLHFTIFLSPTFNSFVLPPTSCNILYSTFHFTTCGASSYISSHGHVKHYADNQENIEFLKGWCVVWWLFEHYCTLSLGSETDDHNCRNPIINTEIIWWALTRLTAIL